MILVIYSSFLLFLTTFSFPDRLTCGRSGEWVVGATAVGFGQMFLPSPGQYVSGGAGCSISISGNPTTYSAGQTFTVSLSSALAGVKVEAIGGATLSKNGNGGSTCLDYNAPQPTFILKAPTAGAAITVRAVCGDQFENVRVATPITLQAGPDVGAPGTIPTSAPVEIPGQGAVSNDPNFAFQVTLQAGTTLFYKQNDTQINFKMVRNSIGYLSFGPGLNMIGSNVLIGMDTTQNAGFNAAGVYNLASKVGSGNAVAKNVAVDSLALNNLGITNASFSIDGVAQTSTLTWTFNLANQKDTFTLSEEDTGLDFIWAVGESRFVRHDNYGTLRNVDFSKIIGGGPGFIADSNLAAHVALMVISWGILVPIGVSMPLFNNIKYSPSGRAFCGISGPMWVTLHATFLTIGVIFGIIGSIVGFVYKSSKNSEHFVDPHESLGLAVFVISIAQPLSGIFRPKKSSEKTLGRKLFEIGHPLFGYVVLILGLANELLGVQELQVVTGGQQYSLNGIVDNPGFTGTLGGFIVFLTIVIIAGLLFGWGRAMMASSQLSSAALEQKLTDDSELKLMSEEEIGRHNTENDCWVIFNDQVYNISGFLNSHPGGKGKILPLAGRDITRAFRENGHSQDALNIMSRFLVGKTRSNPSQNNQLVARASPAIDDANKFLSGDNTICRKATLSEKIQISPNVFWHKFSFSNPQMVLGLPTGKHICIHAPNIPGKEKGKWNGQDDPEENRKEISRKYTPVSSDLVDKGYFTLVTKVYRPNSKFKDGGRMSRFLEGIKPGKQVEFSGPFGGHEYLGRGRFYDNGREIMFKECAMICGGSGITPILQIASAMLRDKGDFVNISVIYANSTVDDILMKDYLDEMENRYPHRFRVWYTVSKDPKSAGSHYSYSTNADWKYSVGRVNKQMIREHFPRPSSDVLVISCGPPSMIQNVSQILREVGFRDDQRLDY